MKFKYNLSLFVKIIMYAVIALQATLLLLLFFKLAHLFGFISNNVAFEVCEVILCALVLVMAVFMLNTRYIVELGKVRVRFGFADLTKSRFDVTRIISLVHNKKKGKLYMNLYEGETPSVIELQLQQKDFFRFYDCLKKENPTIEFLED